MANWKVLIGSLEEVKVRLTKAIADGWRAKGLLARAHSSSLIWTQIVVRDEILHYPQLRR